MLHELTVVQFTVLLNNLSAILDKAEAYAEENDFSVDVLLHSRLSPDQFDLIRQVQIVCDVAKIGVARIAGTTQNTPVHEDNETSVTQLKVRINEVILYINSFKPKDFIDIEKAKVALGRWEGKYLSGQEFLLQCTIPNLYFHLTTAYAILRHNGVVLGKDDFLGEMPYKS
jgi:hypothetical protein